jgi:hypothetical protein
MRFTNTDLHRETDIFDGMLAGSPSTTVTAYAISAPWRSERWYRCPLQPETEKSGQTVRHQFFHYLPDPRLVYVVVVGGKKSDWVLRCVRQYLFVTLNPGSVPLPGLLLTDLDFGYRELKLHVDADRPEAICCPDSSGISQAYQFRRLRVHADDILFWRSRKSGGVSPVTNSWLK